MQKRKRKSIFIFISSLIIGLFSYPFAFAKSVEKKSKEILHSITGPADFFAGSKPSFISVYDSLQINLLGIHRKAFELAQMGFNKMKEQGMILNDSIISIIDFSLPASAKRLLIIDLSHYRILFNTYVAHGRNSGKEFTTRFSNAPSSFMSSLGFYVTTETYFGDHGYSLKLEGVESGINDNASKRKIVIHGADYVNESLIRSQGYIGRSLGCPAIADKLSKPVINTIKQGTCLFIYYPDKKYLLQSPLLN